MEAPLIFNIQKYCIHDGDGIRTTVFFKGCTLRCAWCHNPESQSFLPQLLWQKEKCTCCGACTAVCTKGGGACDGCGRCVEHCNAGARQVSGRRYTLEELVDEISKDRVFYEQSGGGATLSGGEVMQAEPFEYVEALVRRLFEAGCPVNIDTCGQAPYKRFERLLPYVDTFLYDLKIIQPEKHQLFTGVENSLILNNLRQLSHAGARIFLRLPLVKGVNDSDSDIDGVLSFLNTGIHVERVDLLSCHDMGKSKLLRLGRLVEEKGAFQGPGPERLCEIASLFRRGGISNVQVGG